MFFGDSSKDLVFRVLFEEWPLSAKEIYSKVEKLSSKEISYQAVHKLLLSLVDEKVVVKVDGKYLLNQGWVERNLLALSKLLENLKAGSKVFGFEQKFIFDTVYDVDKFLIKFCSDTHLQKEDEVILVWEHFWIPLFFSKEIYREMKKVILGSNFYCVTSNNSPVDKWCADFWKNAGVKERVNVKINLGNSLAIFKDIIIQIFYPYEIRKALDEVYESTNNPSKLDIDNLFESIFEKKTRIPVLISKNQIVADELRKQVKGCF